VRFTRDLAFPLSLWERFNERELVHFTGALAFPLSPWERVGERERSFIRTYFSTSSARLRLAQVLLDHCQNPRSFIQDFFIRKPQNSQVKRRKVDISILIMVPSFNSFVNPTIALDYELGFVTIEVCNIVSELMLSAELEPKQATVAQVIPQ
jgi:hypothetical protein